MSDFFLGVLYRLAPYLLKLRYKIKIQDHIENFDPKKGTLILANHPAEIDPVMLMTFLKKKVGKIRPLVAEKFFFLPFIGAVLKKIDALSVPNWEIASNQWKVKKMERLFQTIEEGLKAGETFLIYPAGKLKTEGKEILGSTFLVNHLLDKYPDPNILLIRTTGLWGSLFSKAFTGKTPSFAEVCRKGFFKLLKNGMFFCPKREVRIEAYTAPKELKRASKGEFNTWLEQWFNQYSIQEKIYTEEPLTLVSFCFWKKEVPHVENKQIHAAPPTTLSEEEQKEILSFLETKTSQKHVNEESDLILDLGLDSLDIADLHAFLSQRFDILPIHLDQLKTVKDIFHAAEGKLEAEEEEIKEMNWFEKTRQDPSFPSSDNIAAAFIETYYRKRHQIAMGDPHMGSLTYNQVFLKAVTLSCLLKRLKGEHIGILLPSSNAAYLLILACLLAGKIPVMLNWTTGARTLEAACKLSKMEHILTSQNFLDNVSPLDLGNTEEKLLLLEEAKKKITFKDKLKALFQSFLPLNILLRKYSFPPNKPAVLLFTSGSEALPKAVYLTHDNILSNQKAACSFVPFQADDVMLGFLPPFHSFGFSVTGILPLLIGVKVFYLPDPTASRKIVKTCKKFKPTILCAAPTFYKGIFRLAKPADLASVRLFVAGAEKVPPELFQAIKKLGPHKDLIEGYGITECSPIVTINKRGEPPRGVGFPLKGIELCILHPETRENLSDKQIGEICIHGPSVFNGYPQATPDPFLFKDHKKWYASGDLGYLDEEGALYLAGRLKRFIKLGGEMISLLAIEEEMIQAALKKGWAQKKIEPLLAVLATKEEKPRVILFTTFKVTKEQINQSLREAGFSNLVKISKVFSLETIPLTGTGKTDYRLLESSFEKKDDPYPL